jgi:hypothetical protein
LLSDLEGSIVSYIWLQYKYFNRYDDIYKLKYKRILEMTKKLFFTVATTALLVGCGGGSGSSGSDSDKTSGNSDSSVKDEKSYTLQVTSTTATNPSGMECKNADGSFTIKDHKMSGTAHDGWGRDYTIDGDVENGKVKGGFAYAGTNAATYEGVISDDDVSGTWKDVGGCEGTWVGTPK